MTDKTIPIDETRRHKNIADLQQEKEKRKRKSSNKNAHDEQTFYGYKIINGAFYLIKQARSGENEGQLDIQLCDFTAKIIEEITQETGLEDNNLLRIQTTRADGFVFPVIEISANKFFSSSGNWINESYGSRLFVYLGSSKREHLRACIQRYSTLDGKDVQRRHVYTFTGWKMINDRWHYLTGSGAISSDGLREDVHVQLGQCHMNRYILPAPLESETLHTAVEAVFDLLQVSPGKRQIGATLLAAIARAPLGECHAIDFGLFLHGYTGTKKSSLTSIALSFFGEFGGVFPSNWSDTDNDMESKSFQAKDGIYVIDDFKPSVNPAEAAKLHAKAERFVRNTGNRAGRGRRNNDMTAKAAPYNRSMTIITGEDLPRGQSLLGRLLILELLKNDVDLVILTRLQRAARDRVLAGLMAAYVQWLAPQIDRLKKQLPQTVLALRDECIHAGFASSHPRAPDIYASLVAGAEIFFDFLMYSGAIEDIQAVILFDDLKSHLKQAFSEQADYQKEQDECERFINLLRSLFDSKKAHLVCSKDEKVPKLRPMNWGWSEKLVKGIDAAHPFYEEPTSEKIGYLDNEKRQVWLNQDTVFAAVQHLAKSQGEAFLVSAPTLWRRMGDRGLIIRYEKRENGSIRWDVKRSVGGSSKRVMILSADLVEGIG